MENTKHFYMLRMSRSEVAWAAVTTRWWN